MPELLTDLLAVTAVIVLSLIWYFYLYPAMKKEYQRKGWTWRWYGWFFKGTDVYGTISEG
ncbi:MAG: hypothetical protein KAV40_05780 [Thermoplasmatales archaeon]|nr:hypothetical protein [Thermoplasmatales archaeon]